MATTATAAGLDLRELEAELLRTRKRLEEWAESRKDAASDLKDRHTQSMQDHEGESN